MNIVKREFVQLWQRVVLEKRCMLCGSPFLYKQVNFEAQGEGPRAFSLAEAHATALFCPACVGALPRRLQGFCPHCGELAAWPLLPIVPCQRCLGQDPPWEELFFHGAFTGALRTLIVQLKFQGLVINGHALGCLLSQHPGLRNAAFDVVVPVPLHEKRLLHRGYNQALEIAKGILTGLRSPAKLTANGLVRVKDSLPQTGLSRKERHTNTKGIFAPGKKLAGKDVLLIDDVFTTGATLHEATRTLLQAGAASVKVAVVARTGF